MRWTSCEPAAANDDRSERIEVTMDLPTLFLASALFFVACNIVISIVIMHELEKRGIKTSILFMRFLVLRYVSRYQEITTRETGHPDPLFYYWIISINLALVTAVIGAVLKRIA